MTVQSDLPILCSCNGRDNELSLGTAVREGPFFSALVMWTLPIACTRGGLTIQALWHCPRARVQ
ncbi:unnamed protein product [Staurois parvus]|uniref:Uncharacterized protein n=1 Tax=Staurois parvus TaxID=386267 RepID=A0ABN9AJK2_9NEOB|nr:unnamed protein product [Staurois parvus]